MTTGTEISGQGESASRARALTPLITGVFFAVATGITAVVGISLLLPGSALDAIWSIKPAEHEQLLRAGNLAAVGFVGLAAIMAVASLGAFRRRRWAWRLALIIFAINGVGDAARIALGAPAEGTVGVAVVALIIFWLTRRRVRDMFAR
jgi:hypothetical protein